MTIHRFVILLSKIWISPLFHVWFKLLLLDLQVSCEIDKVVWYSHLFKNFPQFVVIHTDKNFSIVNEAEIDVFLEFICFFHDPTNVENLISGSSAFSESSLCIWKFFVDYWHLAWRIDFEHKLDSINELNCMVGWTFFGIALLWDWNENWPLPAPSVTNLLTLCAAL